MNLSGKWKNTLNSSVTIIANEDDGTLKGEYHTQVSSVNKPLPPVPFIGTWQKTYNGVLVSFSVQWKFEKNGQVKQSTTTWSGSGWDINPDKFETTWILTSFGSEENSWKNTTINKDIFTRL